MTIAPTQPYLTDEYRPTNEHLWKSVLEVAKGERRDFSLGDRTINAPNEGRGFYPWPHPNGIAWAVKQYNGFNGGWSRKEAGIAARMREGATIATEVGSFEHTAVELLKTDGLVRLASTSGPWHYWEPTYRGWRHFRASLGDDLRRKMDDLLRDFSAEKAHEVGLWFEANFRVNSPKSPKGGKALKDEATSFLWILKHRLSYPHLKPEEYLPGAFEKAKEEIAARWKADIEPNLSQLVGMFTDEGGKVIPKELVLGPATYENEIGVDGPTLEKYAKRLDTIFRSITGWRAAALKNGLKVVLASPRNFTGTVSGKYKRDRDALLIRTTPNSLKRDSAGYGSFEYILVHEMGHRFEKYNPPKIDFDRREWLTTRYSSREGEAFAELFAIGHFNLTGTWDKGIVERFEKVMAG